MTYDDLYFDCHNLSDKFLDQMARLTDLDLPGADAIGEQVANAARSYIAIDILQKQLDEKKDLLKAYLKASIPNDCTIKVDGYDLNHSKPSLVLDKEAWKELQETDSQCLAAVRQLDIWNKKVKEFKAMVSEAGSSKISWKVSTK